MKVGAKRRRTKEEIRQEKLAEREREREIEAQLQEYRTMKDEFNGLKASQELYDEANEVMVSLRESGLLK